ncbi:DgyrCDS3143 [Dimorphilus gyrociliatus]|uniref:DgyrCDS3143 n=1 Tax=Dimorphilus gyrociliatus TaxID=2664684 RepID=A0A7I8VCA2_9ANNE|nr:DgyrCDS3143 [Dimorphilus gyrociliatus]
MTTEKTINDPSRCKDNYIKISSNCVSYGLFFGLIGGIGGTIILTLIIALICLIRNKPTNLNETASPPQKTTTDNLYGNNLSNQAQPILRELEEAIAPRLGTFNQGYQNDRLSDPSFTTFTSGLESIDTSSKLNLQRPKLQHKRSQDSIPRSNDKSNDRSSYSSRNEPYRRSNPEDEYYYY